MTFGLSLLALLALYRVSFMVAAEQGPFGLFLRFRVWAQSKGGWLADGASCIYCVSFWLAWPVAALVPWQGWQRYTLAALGLAGGVVIMKRILDWLGAGA